MLKKSVIMAMSLFTVVALAGDKTEETQKVLETPKQIYSEDIQIVDASEKVIAHINVYGKVTISEGSTSDEVINLLIDRMAKQQTIAQNQMKQMAGALQTANQKAQLTTQKAIEIIQIYAPPVVKEQPKGKEVKNEKKKGFWPWSK